MFNLYNINIISFMMIENLNSQDNPKESKKKLDRKINALS